MKFATTLSIILIGFSALSQLSATTSSQLNTNCNGTDCNYSGPSILINELMISPTDNDGSISGDGGVSQGRGEWIELYNPNLCESVDISCYYLGNNTAEGNGGFVIPSGTVVPPSGFCMIRGANVPPVPSSLLVANGGNVVEIVVPYNITDPGVCTNGTRVWFPNAGGWFAFYDSNGVPQDAVSWVSAAGTSGSPCVPVLSGCGTASSLASYDAIPTARKNYLNTQASLILGSSVRRLPDGGAWDTQAAPTYATCNSTCINPGSSSCTGTATVNVSGGTAPYTYQWDDSQVQTTQTAINLCAGTYHVTVTDNVGATAVFTVTVDDFIPTVSVDVPTQICINASPVSVIVSPIATPGQTGILSGIGVSGGNFNPATAGTGSHTVNYYYEDQFGCSNAATDAILVNPLPTVSITNNQSPYCLSNTPAGLVLSPAGGTLSGTGVVGNQFIPSAAGVGTFTLTYSYTDGNGCSNSTTATVQVTAPPAPTLNIPADVCINGAPITMGGTPNGGIFEIDGTLSTAQFVPGTEGTGNHTIGYTVTDANGCIASATGNITVHGLPNPSMSLFANYCYESGTYPVTTNPSGGSLSGDNLVGNSIDLSGVNPGTYSLTYTYSDQFGCTNTTNASYSVTSPLQPSYTYTTDCFQGVVLTSLISNPNYTYNWNIANTNQGTGVQYSTTLSSYGDLPLELTITDTYGCSYDSIGVIHIDEGAKLDGLTIPNVITPNGDGKNDTFEMPQMLSDCFKFKIFIVNRWGNLVYEMDSPTSVFSGKTKSGADLDEGVYFYFIDSDDFDCEDEKYKGFCQGNITIAR